MREPGGGAAGRGGGGSGSGSGREPRRRRSPSRADGRGRAPGSAALQLRHRAPAHRAARGGRSPREFAPELGEVSRRSSAPVKAVPAGTLRSPSRSPGNRRGSGRGGGVRDWRGRDCGGAACTLGRRGVWVGGEAHPHLSRYSTSDDCRRHLSSLSTLIPSPPPFEPTPVHLIDCAEGKGGPGDGGGAKTWRGAAEEDGCLNSGATCAGFLSPGRAGHPAPQGSGASPHSGQAS